MCNTFLLFCPMTFSYLSTCPTNSSTSLSVTFSDLWALILCCDHLIPSGPPVRPSDWDYPSEPTVGTQLKAPTGNSPAVRVGSPESLCILVQTQCSHTLLFRDLIAMAVCCSGNGLPKLLHYFCPLTGSYTEQMSWLLFVLGQVV